MKHELSQAAGFVRGDSRSLTRAQNAVTDELRLAALKATGAMALSAHLMEGASELDEHRRSVARRCGPEMNAVLIEFEVTGIEQAQKVQRGLYKKLGF